MFKTCDLNMISELHSHDQGEASDVYHFKILVPSVSSGAIIGKKGGIIAQLQEDTGARIKMSKPTEFYPGTTERVCLISGKVEDILKIHEFIMLKIIERPDPNAKIAIDFDHKMPAGRERQVKILIPNSTASMVIGKNGNYITLIKEESGSYIQISQNDKGKHALSERCITVIGDLESNKIACRMILAQIVKDPNSGRCLQVCYTNEMGPIPNFEPVGSPYANPQNVCASTSYDSHESNNVSLNLTSSFHQPQINAAHSGILPLVEIGNAFPSGNALQVIEYVKSILKKKGYSEHAISEITSAMSTLAHYGLLGYARDGVIIGNPVSSGLARTIASPSAMNCQWSPTRISNHDTNIIDASRVKPAAATSSPMETSLSTFNNVPMSSGLPAAISSPMEASCAWSSGEVSNDSTAPETEGAVAMPSSVKFLSGALNPTHILESGLSELNIGPESTFYSNDSFLARSETSLIESYYRTSPVIASPSAASLPVSANSFEFVTKYAQPTFKENVPFGQLPDTLKMQVAENIVGAVFGQEGKALTEIERMSGTSIKISKKGIFAPGTHNRVITICGDLNAIIHARCLIERHICEEEAKRLQGSAIKFRH